MTHPYRTHKRVLTASLVGTAVEFYDFYIYATAAALVFGPLFFPSESASAQLMLSYMSFGLAFFARPVGAIAFGHFGDRIGRKSTLVASLLLMGGSTLLIAFLRLFVSQSRDDIRCCPLFFTIVCTQRNGCRQRQYQKGDNRQAGLCDQRLHLLRCFEGNCGH